MRMPCYIIQQLGHLPWLNPFRKPFSDFSLRLVAMRTDKATRKVTNRQISNSILRSRTVRIFQQLLRLPE